MSKSQKFRNIARNDKVALVVDDITSRDPWRVRCLEIRGTAEQAEIAPSHGRGRRRAGHRDHPGHAAPHHQLRHRRSGQRAASARGGPARRLARRCTPSAASRGGLVDRQVRQHRGGEAARPRVRSQPNNHPATPVTNTVPITGCPVTRASTMCHNPNAAACSSRPRSARMPLRRRCPVWPGRRLPRARPFRSGCPPTASRPGCSGRSRWTIALRTGGKAVNAETPSAAAAPAARPYRMPDHNAGGRIRAEIG